MWRVLILAVLACVLTTLEAPAAEIDGRLGIYGKAGALIPLKDSFISSTSGADPGLAAGGGLILGLCGNWAAELDVSHLTRSDVNLAGTKVFEAALTDVALGVQYRFGSGRLVPFVGAGADFIRGELTSTTGSSYRLDWTFGGHANLGFDYFLTRGIAFSIDARGVYAADGDVSRSGSKVGSYDPVSFIGSFGLRLFLPENAFW